MPIVGEGIGMGLFGQTPCSSQFERMRKGILVIPVQPRAELPRFENSRNVEMRI